MPNIDRLSEDIAAETWQELFPAENPKKLAPDEFEVGLVLGGTVSAGAYTAGVLDFLVEALDAWQAEKASHPESAPDWNTKIAVMTGTSGGGVLAAMTAKAFSWEFSAVRSPEQGSRNPFYRVWVETLDIGKMLDTSDLETHKNLRSVLNATCLEDAAQELADFSTSARKNRQYVLEPLPVILTLTNLRGIPYRVDFGNGVSQAYLDHGDYVRFHVFTRGGNAKVRPDAFGVSESPLSGYLDWKDVVQFALGTGAFPIGFPFRDLTRPLEHYRYRPIIVPGDGTTKSPSETKPRKVDWWRLRPEGATDVVMDYHFLAADGGMWNNEPVELCHRELAGILGRNPRNGMAAKRAVILVDPFCEAPTSGLDHFTKLSAGAMGLISTWKDQARYNSQDQLLAAMPDCFSRFIVTARRGEFTGGKAIASASLGAFGGFLCRDYRDHDYFLGRRNCQRFLRHTLALPSDNELFASWRKAYPQKAAELESECHEPDDGTARYLPLIPLFGACQQEQVALPYPSGKFSPRTNSFQKALKNRIEALYDKAKDENGVGTLPRWYLDIGMFFGARSMLTDTVNNAIEEGLKEWGL